MNYDSFANPLRVTASIFEELFGLSKLSNEMQAKIVYLFIKTDGNSSAVELLRFDKFCEHIKLKEETKHSIIGFCECLHLKPNADNSSIIISEIDKILKEKFESESNYIDKDRINQAFVIWTLLNLAYADFKYTEPERKVIEYLVENWKMDSVLIDEMNDTLDTVRALSNQIEWLKTTNQPYNYAQETIKEYESNIKSLFSNIELSVSEANI